MKNTTKKLSEMDARIKTLKERRAERREGVEQLQPQYNKAGRKYCEEIEAENAALKSQVARFDKVFDVKNEMLKERDAKIKSLREGRISIFLDAKQIKALKEANSRLELELDALKIENAALKEERIKIHRMADTTSLHVLSMEHALASPCIVVLSDGSRWIQEGDTVKAGDILLRHSAELQEKRLERMLIEKDFLPRTVSESEVSYERREGSVMRVAQINIEPLIEKERL